MKLFEQIMFFFVAVQIIGLFVGNIVVKDLTKNPYVNSLVVTNDINEPLNAGFFLAYVIFGAVAIMLLIKMNVLREMLFKILEFFMIAGSSSIVFYALLRLAFGYDISTTAGSIFGLAFSALKIYKPQLKNLAAIVSTAGVGVVFGISMGIMPMIIFLALLAIYDFVAVFLTKHMVEMANFVVKNDLAFTVTAREPGKTKDEKERRVDLGTGDLVAPVMMEVSLLSINPLASGVVFVGAIISTGIFIWLVKDKKVVLPALPPIVIGMLLSFAVGKMFGIC